MGSQPLVPQTESIMIVNCIMFFLFTPILFFLFQSLLLVPAVMIAIIGGYFLGKKMVQSQLKAIEKHGVYTTSWKYWLSFIAVICITVIIVIAAIKVFPAEDLAVAAFGLMPVVPASWITRLMVYRNWEQKNNRTLYYTTGIHGKIYPYPYMFYWQVPETQANKNAR